MITQNDRETPFFFVLSPSFCPPLTTCFSRHVVLSFHCSKQLQPLKKRENCLAESHTRNVFTIMTAHAAYPTWHRRVRHIVSFVAKKKLASERGKKVHPNKERVLGAESHLLCLQNGKNSCTNGENDKVAVFKSQNTK